jgi:crossover junction endodeoxyribonuclease RusA
VNGVRELPVECADIERAPALTHHVLLLPFTRPLSLNDRAHWGAKAAMTARWRAATFWAAKEARVPQATGVRVGLIYAPRDSRRRDADNLVAALKPCCDGLVDARVVPDDCLPFMERDMPTIWAGGPPFAGGGRFALTVEVLAL